MWFCNLIGISDKLSIVDFMLLFGGIGAIIFIGFNEVYFMENAFFSTFINELSDKELKLNCNKILK
jgi:hypothetical protein